MLTWLLRLAALGLAFLPRRAPWCWCSHWRDVHEHYSHGTYCSRCRCPKFSAPFIRRTS